MDKPQRPMPHPSSFNQPGAGYLLEWAAEKLATCRSEIESPALDVKPESTIRLRARIGLLSELLSIPDESRKAHT